MLILVTHKDIQNSEKRSDYQQFVVK